MVQILAFIMVQVFNSEALKTSVCQREYPSCVFDESFGMYNSNIIADTGPLFILNLSFSNTGCFCFLLFT